MARRVTHLALVLAFAMGGLRLCNPTQSVTHDHAVVTARTSHASTRGHSPFTPTPDWALPPVRSFSLALIGTASPVLSGVVLRASDPVSLHIVMLC